MAIDALARGLAASNSGGGGGSLDVGLEEGVGIKITGDDPKKISNDGVTNITASNDDADDGTVKVVFGNRKGDANFKHVPVKGLTETAFTPKDTIANVTKKDSTNVPTTKAVVTELLKKVDVSSLGAPTAGTTKGVATLDENGKLPTGQLTEHTHKTSDISSLAGYTIAEAIAEIDEKDTLNEALGKIQKTLNSKQDASIYAGATVNGGSATSAVRLDAENIGSETKGVYIDENGQPVAMTYELGMDVPEGSKLTDTTYSQGTGIMIDDENKIINMGIRSLEPTETTGDNGTFKIVKAKEDGTSEVEYIPVKGLSSAAYKQYTAEITEENKTSDGFLPTVNAVMTQVDKKINEDKVVTATSNGVMLASDKAKIDGMDCFADDEAMKLAIDGMFSGFDMSGLDAHDDDGIADPEDVENIFDGGAEPPSSREPEVSGSFVSLSADEIDNILPSASSKPTTSDEDDDDSDLDAGDIDDILGI